MFIFTLPANIFEDIANGIKNVFNAIGQFFAQLVNTFYTLGTILTAIGSAFGTLQLAIPLLTPLFLVFEISLLIGTLRSI